MAKTIELILEYLPKIIGGIVILLLGWLLSSLFSKFLKRILTRTKVDFLVIKYFSETVRFGLLALTIIIVLSKIGINIGPFLVGLGAGGLVVGFAVRDILSDFANGVMILLYRPFQKEDYVKIGGVEGFVTEISIVNTKLRTTDEKIILVPNKNVWGQIIVKYKHSKNGQNRP